MDLRVREFPAQTVTDYRTLRPRLRSGDVMLCSGNGVFSAMIQQVTESVWSHAALVLRLDAIDRVMLLESVEPVGVRTIRLSKYLDNYRNDGLPYPGGIVVIRHRHFERQVDAEKLKELSGFAVNCLGRPYDREDIARIAARIMAARLDYTQEQWRRIERNEDYICSEYVARCYEQIGLPVRQRHPAFVAPADFAADPHFELVGVLKAK